MRDQAPTGSASVNVPPPPARTGRSWGRLLLVGGGGCLMLVVLMLLGFAGCLAALNGGGTAEEPQKDPTAGIGEPLRVGGISWVVQDAKTATELTSSYEKPVRGNFVVVDFTFTNEGRETATLDTTSMTLVDSEGRRSEADPDKFGYIPEGRNIFLENVNPGVTDQGQAIFTVAPGATGFELELGDADLFSDTKGTVPLGI